MKSNLIQFLIGSLCVFGFCTAVQAQDYGLNRLANLPYTERLSNCWGYTAPDGTEYALVGAHKHLSIVNIKNPSAPIVADSVPGPTTIWREMKAWKEYCYLGMDNVTVGLQIIDLSTLPDSVKRYKYLNQIKVNDTLTLELKNIHDVQVDDKGYLYLSGTNLSNGAVVIFDLNPDPWNPVFKGIAGNVYSHDNYVRNDTMWSSDIFAGEFSVWKLGDRSNPELLAKQTTPSKFTHNAWLTDDSKHLLTTDERFGAYLASYDVSDLQNIKLVDVYQADTGYAKVVSPHNVHIKNNFGYLSYYMIGLKVVDCSRPHNLLEVASFDTYAPRDSNTFKGAWGVYPYFKSGVSIVSDINTGLHIFAPAYKRACYLEGVVRDAVTKQVIPGARIAVAGTNIFELTNGLGEFATGFYKAGSYSAAFSFPNYTTASIPVSFDYGKLIVLDVELVPLSVNSAGVPASQVSITPNPVIENITIQVNQDFEDYQVIVINSLGQQIYQSGVLQGNQNIPTESWIPGYYWVKIKQQQGKELVTQLFKQ